MPKILIRELSTPGGPKRYCFKPLRYIDHFFEQTQSLPGIRWDPKLRRCTAPATEGTITFLEATFGSGVLEWEGQFVAPGGMVSVQKKTEGRSDDGSTWADWAAEQWLRGANVDKVKLKAAKPSTDNNRYNAPTKDDEELPAHWQAALLKTEEALRVRRYSWRTVKSYLGHLRRFLASHPALTLREVTTDVIRAYINDRIKNKRYAEATQNQLLQALKFWLEKVEGRNRIIIDLWAKKTKPLPQVLSVEEVSALFAQTPNLKHRCILMTIYSGGLRLGEVCRLRIQDILVDRRQIFVHGGKGKKDRYTTLADNLVRELVFYRQEYRPQYWLFEGQNGGAYSARSVQAILRRSVAASGINAFATVHTLRHSYATHLLEAGVSLRHIQRLLGHASSTTTEIYTHVSNQEIGRIESPLDRIQRNHGGEGEDDVIE